VNKYLASAIQKFGHFLQRVGNECVAYASPNLTKLPHPALISKRNVELEQLVPGGGLETFDQPAYNEINQARLNHLASLDLPLTKKRVIDIGCGVGHLAQFFVERGCEVVCVDGRPENIAGLHQRYPDLSAHVVDVEHESLTRFGQFEVVFAYGLLYHLESPVATLHNMASVCQELLLLETQICDHPLPIVRLADETNAFSQALRGLGCRPSPSYVVLALNRVGFPFVYAPKSTPQHPEFQFAWKNNLDWRRNKHPMRCVFIASKIKLQNPKLINLLED
jgi:SAM-dependent methyltransferase